MSFCLQLLYDSFFVLLLIFELLFHYFNNKCFKCFTNKRLADIIYRRYVRIIYEIIQHRLQKIEIPLNPPVVFYSCGPTVYDLPISGISDLVSITMF